MSVREITDADIETITDLLADGFPNPRRHWEAGLARLRARSVPPGLPRYGYMLEADGRAVGVILLISSVRRAENQEAFFSNLSSWYVETGYRSYATLLYRRTLTHKDTTYLNISAATYVRPIVEAFGFKRYSEGQVLAGLALARSRISGRARILGVHDLNKSSLAEDEQRLLKTQASYGCVAFCCQTDARAYPFVFVPRSIKGFIPCVQLAYCRSVEDLVDVAGIIGRYLLRIGRPLVLIDANGPIPGVPGRYFADVSPRYFKGRAAPALGDLTETEVTIFGL